jgi:hypothetical protein
VLAARGAERGQRRGKLGSPRGRERRGGVGAARERERHWVGSRGVRRGRFVRGIWGAGPWDGVAWLTILPLIGRFLGRLGFVSDNVVAASWIM